MDYATRYLKLQRGQRSLDQHGESIDKWITFNAEIVRHGIHKLPDLNPFAEKLFAQFPVPLSAEQKTRLALAFLQFSCEALMVFEQCFMYANRKSKALVWKNPQNREAQQLFVQEEFFHTKLFRQYLRHESSMKFPQNSYILHQARRLKNIFAWILKQEPLAILLPGSKSESFSVHLTHFLEANFSAETTTITRLHKMHTVDEAYHIPLDYEFVKVQLANRHFIEKLKFVAYNLLMIFFIQWIVIIGFLNIAKDIFPKFNLLQRLAFVCRFFRWTLWNFAPYQKTRQSLKVLYARHPEFYFSWIGRISTL